MHVQRYRRRRLWCATTLASSGTFAEMLWSSRYEKCCPASKSARFRNRVARASRDDRFCLAKATGSLMHAAEKGAEYILVSSRYVPCPLIWICTPAPYLSM
jgi:hypothetical protein